MPPVALVPAPGAKATMTQPRLLLESKGLLLAFSIIRFLLAYVGLWPSFLYPHYHQRQLEPVLYHTSMRRLPFYRRYLPHMMFVLLLLNHLRNESMNEHGKTLAATLRRPATENLSAI